MSSRFVFLALLFGVPSAWAAGPFDLLSQEWGMNSTYGVDAPKAWRALKHVDCSSAGIVVAVIDTGIDTTHPALKDSLWVNQKEAHGKAGRDNDGDGYVGDVNGWDFATNSGHLVDNHGHGTHIAGIISANGQGKENFKGVCPGVKIMALRYYDERASGTENLRNTIRSINFAVDHGANIINYSGGGAEFSNEEYAALKRAESKGILVVAAAGNEHSNADERLYFPAAYSLSNIISVTAVDVGGKILASSNWGVKKVQVAAPGNAILSTAPGHGYQLMTGTSQATAFVSGIAALLWSENRALNYRQVKSIIERSAKKYPQLVGKAQTGALVNAYSAVNVLLGKRALSSTVPVATAPSGREHVKVARKTSGDFAVKEP